MKLNGDDVFPWPWSDVDASIMVLLLSLLALFLWGQGIWLFLLLFFYYLVDRSSSMIDLGILLRGAAVEEWLCHWFIFCWLEFGITVGIGSGIVSVWQLHPTQLAYFTSSISPLKLIQGFSATLLYSTRLCSIIPRPNLYTDPNPSKLYSIPFIWSRAFPVCQQIILAYINRGTFPYQSLNHKKPSPFPPIHHHLVGNPPGTSTGTITLGSHSPTLSVPPSS